MSSYEISPEDVEKTLSYLKHHDPKNADEEYAVQLLHAMNETAKEIVASSSEELSFDQLVAKTIDSQQN